MGLQRIEATGRSEADPAAVYALLRDGSTWPEWSPIESFRLEREGEGGGEGLGAVRVWTTGRHTLHEEVVELVEDRRFGYTVLSGMAIKGYRATVELEPDGTGTAITWSATFRAKVPGFGGLYARALTGSFRKFVDGLAEAAEAATATVPAPRDT